MAFSPDGRLVAAPAGAVYELAWSPDGASLFAAPLDATVVRLDAPVP